MSLLHHTKNPSAPLDFLPVGTLEGRWKWPNHLFTQSTFLTATDCHFFFPAHKFEPDVVVSGLSFMSLFSPFWNPCTAFLAWNMSFCTYTSCRVKLTPFYPVHCRFIPQFLGGLCVLLEEEWTASGHSWCLYSCPVSFRLPSLQRGHSIGLCHMERPL